MQRLLAAALTAILLSMMGLSVHGQEGKAKAIDAIPESASVVVRLKSPQATAAKLGEFVDAVQPGFGGIVTASLPQLGEVIKIPGFKGVDLEQDIWLILFADPQSQPTFVFVLTAKDVDAVKETLEEAEDEYEVHTAGNIVLYSNDEESIAEVRKSLEGEGKRLWPKIEAATRKLFEDSHVAALVNIQQMTDDFSDELERAEPMLDEFLENISNIMPEEQHAQLEGVFDLYRDIGKAVLHGIRDSKTWTVGVTFSKSAIQYRDRLEVTGDTPTSAFLKKQEPGDLQLLNHLPADKGAYVGAKFDMSDMIEWSMKLSRKMMTDATPEKTAQFDEAVNEMKKLKYNDFNFYMDLSGEVPAMRLGSVISGTLGENARAINHKLMKCIGELKTPQFTQTTKLETNVDKIDGQEVDRVTIKQTFDDSADPLGFQSKLHALLFGDEGMQQLVMYRRNTALQTMGEDLTEMKNLVAALDAKKSNNTALMATRERLFEKANVLVLFDIARLAAGGLRLAADQHLIPLDSAALEALKLEASYIGYGLTIEATSVRSQIEIPVTQIQSLAKFAPLLQGAGRR